jgi:predicted esterase
MSGGKHMRMFNIKGIVAGILLGLLLALGCKSKKSVSHGPEPTAKLAAAADGAPCPKAPARPNPRHGDAGVSDAAAASKDEVGDLRLVPEYASLTQFISLPIRHLPKRKAWQKAAPGIEEISIPRDGDERPQPALWYNSKNKGKKPLLMLLHSWSANYLQHFGIPYGVFAVRNDWIFINPNYRGDFDNSDATASKKAVKDVLSALAYAKANAPVDESRIYLAGYSGGAMMSLIMAGRYPDEFTAVVAWVPVYDLSDWYETLSRSTKRYARGYINDIEASCGGRPDSNREAARECARRSPSAHLPNARGKKVKIFVSGGIHDHFVPPSHALRAFNDLARREDRISKADMKALDRTESLPPGMRGNEIKNRHFEKAEAPVVFGRESGNGVVYLFDGGHNIIYNAGFEWLSRQKKR